MKRVGWLEERTDAESKKHPNYKNEMEKLIKELEDKEFNKIEKEIINYIFSFKEVREIICKNDKLIEGITAFLERIFFYKTDLDWPHSLSHFFRQGFFIKNKKYVGVTEEAYIDRLKEIAEFERVSLEHYRKLRNKIRIISNFSDEEFFDLTVKTPLRKYQYMPNLMDIKKAKNNEEKIKMVNLWSKIYFQDEIPEGW